MICGYNTGCGCNNSCGNSCNNSCGNSPCSVCNSNRFVRMTTPISTGVIPTLTIGTVTTGEPGTPASASITGTPPNYVLNLTIPQFSGGTDATITPAGAVADLPTDADLTAVITTINTLLANLRTAGLLATS